jgi:thymidylate kinase
MLQLAYLWVAFTIGFWTRVYPRLLRNHLVLFDRYYQDLLVDPRRYRYGGPPWMAGLIGRAIPNPELVVVFDAAPDVVLQRKREIDGDALAALRGRYRAMASALPNACVVDSSKSIQDVGREVTRIVLERMSTRGKAVKRANEQLPAGAAS